MRRPVVGICTHLEQVRWGVWDRRADVTGGDLVYAVQRAGAQALLIPADPALVDDPGALLERIDGLVVEAREDADGDGWPESLRARVEAAGVPVLRAVMAAGNGSTRAIAGADLDEFVAKLRG
jgi:putative glutamine amidotransferase